MNWIKIKISKIGLRHVLGWPKLGLVFKFHDPGVALEIADKQTHGQTDKIHVL